MHIKAYREWWEEVGELIDEWRGYTGPDRVEEEYDEVIRDIVGGERMCRDSLSRIAIIDYHIQVKKLLAVITSKPKLMVQEETIAAHIKREVWDKK